ncbi:hypothetical protein AgCh_008634 [Apium graveolens]
MPPRRRGTRARPAESVNQQRNGLDDIVNEESEEDLDYNEYDEEEYVEKEGIQIPQTPEFLEYPDPVEARAWLKEIEKSFEILEFVNTEEKKVRRFQLVLKQWIQNRVAVPELTDYATLVQKASIVEAGSEQSLKEKQKRKRKIGSQGGGGGTENRSLPSRATFNRPLTARTFNMTVQNAFRKTDVIAGEFDVILGMNWLSSNGAQIDMSERK